MSEIVDAEGGELRARQRSMERLADPGLVKGVTGLVGEEPSRLAPPASQGLGLHPGQVAPPGRPRAPGRCSGSEDRESAVRYLKGLRVLAALSLSMVLLAACSERDKPPRVRLWALAPPEITPIEESGRVPLRFAVALTISPQEGYRLYGDLTEGLGQKIGRPVRLILRRTFSEVNDLVRRREAEVAQLCSRGFFQGHADFGLTSLAVPVVNGRTSHSSYVIASAESEIGTPGGLEGKTFAYADPLCVPEPFPAGRRGQRLDGFFKRKLTITSHDRAIRAVAEGQVDGAFVDGLVYARLALTDPGQIAKTKVIGETARYMNSPIVVHPMLDPTLKEELRKAFLTLHQEQTGRAVLARLGIDRFVAPGGEVGRRPASRDGGDR